MTTEEKSDRFDKIWAKAHELAEKALAAGDQDAMLVFRCTMPSTTAKEAAEQRERIKAAVAKSIPMQAEEWETIACPDCGADLKVVANGRGGCALRHIKHN